jgi:hypothetical protein
MSIRLSTIKHSNVPLRFSNVPLATYKTMKQNSTFSAKALLRKLLGLINTIVHILLSRNPFGSNATTVKIFLPLFICSFQLSFIRMENAGKSFSRKL